jgi:hypothetical protein
MLPTLREILINRMLLHRRRGEYDVAAELRHDIKGHDKQGDWAVEPDECPGEHRNLVDLGFSLFACRLFEQHGMMYAVDLAQWSENQLRSVTHLGTPRMIKKVRDVLQICGLMLREPRPEEPPPRRAPLARWLERRRRRHLRRLSQRRKHQIMELVARNVSAREISRRLGYRSHTTVWVVKREMRSKASGTGYSRAGGRAIAARRGALQDVSMREEALFQGPLARNGRDSIAQGAT